MGTRGTFGTPKKRETFLRALASGTVTVEQAAASIGAGRRTVYRWRQENEEFRRAWDEAVETCTDRFEVRLQELAMAGDTTALIFLLRSRKPEIYNPNLVLRRAMLQLSLERARAEAGTTPIIEGQAEHRPMIYPLEARRQLELPKLLSGKAPATTADIVGQEEQEEEDGA